MPTIPWIKVNDAEAGGEMTVMASRFEVRSIWQVPGFFVTSMRLWRQALRSPGAIGVSLKAQPGRRIFWTLSSWTDKQAIHRYAATEPHRSGMRSKRGVMKESTFVFWTAPADSAEVAWAEAEARIAAERASGPSA
ncbi:DUF3291 domain-containing protein [Nonomuraea sp. NPDC050310]|uniref:DUF3291 domain-containing protein n=1 Tax=unclassified Nonomuraea TaxID=2593643 RepID=UPI0033EC4765